MAEAFDLRVIDDEGSRELAELRGWPRPVPLTARVLARAAAQGRDVVVSVRTQPDGYVVITALEVVGNAESPITGDVLRSFRVSKVESAVRQLLRLPDWSGWTTVSIIGPEDLSAANSAGNLETLLYSSSPVLELLKPDDPDRAKWLTDLKSSGPRSVGSVETVRALAAFARSHPGVGLHKLVREVLEMPKATATRWIRAASEAHQEIGEVE